VSGLQSIALITGSLEVVLILVIWLLQQSRNWKLALLLIALAFYNLIFFFSGTSQTLVFVLSFLVSFLFLDLSFDKMFTSRTHLTGKYLLLFVVCSVGFLLTFTVVQNSPNPGMTLLAPFLLVQNFFIVTIVETIHKKQTLQQDGLQDFLGQYMVILALGSFFLIPSKLTASYFITNGFFVLLLIQPYIIKLFKKDIEEVTRVELNSFDSPEELFEYWNFTPSEKEIATLLLNGNSTAEIAECRFTEVSTVRKQVSNLMGKAGVSEREAFVVVVTQLLKTKKDV